jgi:hypothetical protein
MEIKEFLSVTSYTSNIPWAPRKYEVVMVRNRSWPAVSHICHYTHNERVVSSLTELKGELTKDEHTCNLMRLPSNWIFLILKSMPMVVMNVGEKESLAYLSSRQVFPTPKSLRQYFIRKGKESKERTRTLTTVANHQKLDLHIKSVISGSHLE